MLYYRRGRIDWYETLFFPALALILVFVLYMGWVEAKRQIRCKDRGGVWITKTGCVQIVDGQLKKV